MDKDKRLMKASWWERLTERETGSCSDGQGHVNKSLIHFSVDGRACVPSLLFDLKPNYGGGNEDNGDFLQKAPCMQCCTQCLQPWSRPPPTHASAGDSWTLMGMSGSVSYGDTAPFFWALVLTRFCLWPPRVLFPQSCVSFGGSVVELMVTSSQRAFATPRSAALRAPAASHWWPVPSQETPDTVLAQSLWVGRAFCALPRSEQLRWPGPWQVHSPRWVMHLKHLPGPGHLVSQVRCKSTNSFVPYVSSGELISGYDPTGIC